MSKNQQHDKIALVPHDEQEHPGTIAVDQVLVMPVPMQGYLKYAQVVGKEPVHTVRLSQ